jgi:hypothetical protein
LSLLSPVKIKQVVAQQQRTSQPQQPSSSSSSSSTQPPAPGTGGTSLGQGRCITNANCPTNLACVNGLCRTCSSDSQCKSGQACVNGTYTTCIVIYRFQKYHVLKEIMKIQRDFYERGKSAKEKEDIIVCVKIFQLQDKEV